MTIVESDSMDTLNKQKMKALDAFMNGVSFEKVDSDNVSDKVSHELSSKSEVKDKSGTEGEYNSFFSFNPIKYSGDVKVANASESSLNVARFGRVYKRKKNSNIGYICKQKSTPGYRYCRFCDALLPEDAFYTNIKRYVCRKHHYRRVEDRKQERRRADSAELEAVQAWYALADKRFVFGYDKLRFDVGDVREILRHLKLPSEISPRIIPIDPTIPLRPRNLAIVSCAAFTKAFQLYSFVSSKALFVMFVQKCNLVPKNFDISNSKNPYEDPNYVREDADVYKIFMDEMNEKTESMDLDIIEEIEKDGVVPWLTCKQLPPGEAGNWKDGSTRPG